MTTIVEATSPAFVSGDASVDWASADCADAGEASTTNAPPASSIPFKLTTPPYKTQRSQRTITLRARAQMTNNAASGEGTINWEQLNANHCHFKMDKARCKTGKIFVEMSQAPRRCATQLQQRSFQVRPRPPASARTVHPSASCESGSRSPHNAEPLE